MKKILIFLILLFMLPILSFSKYEDFYNPTTKYEYFLPGALELKKESDNGISSADNVTSIKDPVFVYKCPNDFGVVYLYDFFTKKELAWGDCMMLDNYLIDNRLELINNGYYFNNGVYKLVATQWKDSESQYFSELTIIINDTGNPKSEKVCVGGLVWEDKNANGLQDDGPDSGIDGDIIKLYDSNGNEIDETLTANGGKYEFCDLEPNTDYKIYIGRISGYERTVTFEDDDKDLDSDLVDDNYIIFTTGTEDIYNLDAGFVKKEEVEGNTGKKMSFAIKRESARKVCKDSTAINFSNKGQHDQSLCRYEKKIINKKDIYKYNDFKNQKEGEGKNKKEKKIILNNKCPIRFLNTDLLKKGDKKEIKKLQGILNSFEDANLEINGIYDQKTREAVIKYQKKYSGDILRPWRIVRPTGEILDTMVGHLNKRYREENGCVKEEKCSIKFNKYLNLGSKGEEVRKVQSFLKDLGFYKGDIDGVYGLMTKEAVRSFQNENWAEVLKPWGIPCKCGTGYWYQTTMNYANKLIGCKEKLPKLKGAGKPLACVIENFPEFRR